MSGDDFQNKTLYLLGGLDERTKAMEKKIDLVVATATTLSDKVDKHETAITYARGWAASISLIVSFVVTAITTWLKGHWGK